VPPGVTKVRPLLGAGYTKDSSRGNAVSWFDDVAIYTVNEAVYQQLAQRPEPPELAFERKSAARYVVKVHGAKAPFVLVQSEAHDGLWSARYADGESVESMPMFSTINGFLIGRTGDFEVVVEYELDKWFRLGVPITIAVIVLCLLFLIYGWWRSRTGGYERKAASGGTSRGLGRHLAAAVARINEPNKNGLRGR
jgi:hypothetical protein